jgi:iron complex outermembrane receptor protein
VLANMPPGWYQVDVTWPDGRLGTSRTVALGADSNTADFTLGVDSFAETVTVAAKREEPLARTPATIDVLPGPALSASGTTDVMQIDAYVPNMHLTNSGGRASVNYLSMRGFINTETAIDPSIAIYVDGVPVTDFYSTSQSLANVEQVEVLKGPQGTLYGVNSQAGVINIRSPRPTNEWHGGLGANIGTFGTINPTATVAGPLVKRRSRRTSSRSSRSSPPTTSTPFAPSRSMPSTIC